MRSIMVRNRFDIGVSLRYTMRRPGLEVTAAAAGDQRRQIFVAVTIAVGQSCAVDDHRVVEQAPSPSLMVFSFSIQAANCCT